MNVAFLITGQIRFNHNFKENINQFLSELIDVNVDFFCTTWYEENIDLKRLNEDFDFKVLDVETYNPYTSCFIKNYDEFQDFCLNYKNDDPVYKRHAHTSWLNKAWQNTPCVFYKIYRGYNIIEQYSLKNNKKYDLVIRLRSDCFLRDICSEHTLIHAIHSNKLCIYSHNFQKFLHLHGENDVNVNYHKFIDGWIDETMFYCNMNTFKKFSNIYFDFFNIAKTENTWVIHLIMKHFLKKEMIDIKNPNFKIALSRANDKMIFIFDYLNP